MKIIIKCVWYIFMVGFRSYQGYVYQVYELHRDSSEPKKSIKADSKRTALRTWSTRVR